MLTYIVTLFFAALLLNVQYITSSASGLFIRKKRKKSKKVKVKSKNRCIFCFVFFKQEAS